jgi:hypothetical protein
VARRREGRGDRGLAFVNVALRHAAIVAALLDASAIASIFLERGAGSIWSQLLVLFLMTPAALGGGYLRAR